MFSNYLKLAWRVLGRKKLFTVISLFGISFTLGILMVVISFMQSELGTNTPMSNKDQMVLLERLRLERVFYDTIMTVDTIVEAGVVVYDTTYEYERSGRWMWNSSMNNGIAEDYLSDLNTVNKMTIFNDGAEFDTYVNRVKVTFNAIYADPTYFEVFDHQILEGRPMDQSDMDNALQVVVISTKAAKEYFGKTRGVVGEEMFLDGKNFKVIGIYPDKGKVREFVCPHLVMPYSLVNEEDQPTFYHGFYSVIFLKKPNATFREVKDEIDEKASIIPLDHPSKPEGYNAVVLPATSYDEMFAKGIYYDEDEEKSYLIMKWVLLSLLAFFTLLPTLNLINLNVGRILERSSEIGVRKAFGAHQGNLITQFIVENVVQTIIGGLIGLALALVLIKMINEGGALGDVHLDLNPKFFLYSFLATLAFGILSGLLPAYRMSKLPIVNALKNNIK